MVICARSPSVVKYSNEYLTTDTAGRIMTAWPICALPAGADVVACCRGPYCVSADEAVWELTLRGFGARRLIDGFPEWKRAGLPVAAGKDS